MKLKTNQTGLVLRIPALASWKVLPQFSYTTHSPFSAWFKVTYSTVGHFPVWPFVVAQGSPAGEQPLLRLLVALATAASDGPIRQYRGYEFAALVCSVGKICRSIILCTGIKTQGTNVQNK